MVTNRRRHRFAAAQIGAICWIVAVCIFALGNIIAQLGWETPYSLRNNNISDLGNVRCENTNAADNPPVRYICSPLHALFNVSAAAAGLLIILGVVLTVSYWGKGFASMTARVLISIGACGYLFAALWPADVDLNLHVLGALFIMGAGNIGLLVAGLTFRHGPLQNLRGSTLIIAAFAFAGTILHFGQDNFGLGMGGAERVAVFALDVWLAITAVFILRRTHGPRRRGRAMAHETRIT